MVKETQKDKIARLERELDEQRKRNEQLSQELYTLKNQADTDFKDTLLYKQMQTDIDKYKQYKALYEDIKNKRDAERKEYKALLEEYNKKPKSGRPKKITDTEKELIKLERASGATLQALASKYGYSFGTVQAICKSK